MRILVDEATLRQRVAELAERISADYHGRTLDLICLLGGASVFAVDLIRQLRVPARMHQLGFESYPGGQASGEVRITLDVSAPLIGCHVLVVEGVVISGRTPKYVMDILGIRRPASLEMCALGIKPEARAVDLRIAYFGFELGPEIAVGYGIGHGSERALPHIVERTSHL